MGLVTLAGSGAILALLPWRWVLGWVIVLGTMCLAVYAFGPATHWVPLLLVSAPVVLAGWVAALLMWSVFNRMRSA